MKLERQMMFWTLGLIVFIGIIFLLRGILLPFVAGMALAYFLDPLADRLESLKFNRLAATSVIVAVFTLLFILVLVLIVPVLVVQIASFAEHLPGHIEKLETLLKAWAPDWLKGTIAQALPEIKNSLSQYVSKGASLVGALAGSLWSGGVALINFLSLFVVTPIVAFYLLYDWDRMIAQVDSWLPRDHAPILRELGREIDAAMAGFVRGQGTVCLILGMFYAVALKMIGLDFGLLIGLGAGFLSFVPYVGAIIGLVVSVGVALVQFWPEWPMILSVLAVFVFGQFVEGNFLSPKLVGKSVGLHPVWLMFALFAFGLLFGFVGLLVAVPLAASIGVLIRFALKKYLASPLYLGTQPKRSSVKKKPAASK